MTLRFVTRQVHAYLDYPIALSLIAMPFVLGLGASKPLALWLSVVTGIAAFVLYPADGPRNGCGQGAAVLVPSRR